MTLNGLLGTSHNYSHKGNGINHNSYLALNHVCIFRRNNHWTTDKNAYTVRTTSGIRTL